MLIMTVNWTKLAEIQELVEYFEEDFAGFQKKIEEYISEIEKFSPEELDRLAQIRVLEVTNGCLQWSFRRQDKECLSVEQTRECMKTVIGFIKEKKLYFPTEGLTILNEKVSNFIGKIRSIYQSAFKQNNTQAREEFYAASTAIFIVCGYRHIETAFALVKQNYEDLFTPYFLDRGRRYIAPYLACLEGEDN